MQTSFDLLSDESLSPFSLIAEGSSHNGVDWVGATIIDMKVTADLLALTPQKGKIDVSFALMA